MRPNGSNATVIWPGVQGGTGVDNTGKTIRLGGNLVTGGALSTTGAGPTFLNFPDLPATFTFPSTTATLMSATANNATLPEARNNLLYTPAVCDGKSGENGAMTSGSAGFTSATAAFVAADVGKLISVNAVGSTQYFGTATIVGGGAGHTVGEEIPITGGTGTAGSVVVRSVSGGVITAVAGMAGSLGSYSVVPANPVTVGDATLTVTWLRDNLVTTIQSVTTPTSAVLASAASASGTGLMWGYGTDNSTAINAAIATGNKASLPKGICGIAASIVLASGQVLEGNGTAGGAGVPPGALMWLGAVGGTMVDMNATVVPVNGTRVGPFNLLGLGAASYGGRFRGVAQSTINMQVHTVKDFGFSFEESSSAPGSWDTFFNDFKTTVSLSHAASRNAVGLHFPKAVLSSGAHDANGNNFYNTFVVHQDGIGIDLNEGYINNFYMTQLFNNGGNGWGLRLGGLVAASSPMRAHGNNFYSMLTEGNVLSVGGGSPAFGNTIDTWDTQAFFATATVEAGSTLYCTTNGISTNANRNSNFCTPAAFGKLDSSNPAAITDTVDYRIIAVKTFTPRRSGNMTLTVTGGVENDTAGSAALLTGFFGIGTAPVNGDIATSAGSTRFQCGGFPSVKNPAAATIRVPFAVDCKNSGFTSTQEWWYALAAKVVTSGTVTITNVYLSHSESP